MPDKFSFVKRGYDPTAVDLYIEELENEIRSYKSKDEAIRNAIISAQVAADNIVQNAKNQGRSIKETSAKHIYDIVMSLGNQRQNLQNFMEEYQAVMTKYLKPLDNPDFVDLNQKLDTLERYLKSFGEEIKEDLTIVDKADKAGRA